MSASRPRSGSSVEPTQASAGADGNLTSPRVYTFDPYVRPVIVCNFTAGGRVIRVKVNATAATEFGGGSDDGLGYLTVADDDWVDVSLGGLVNVTRISFVTTNAADDLDDVEVHGWQP